MATFRTRLNPKNGKRERVTVDNTVKKFTAANYTVAGTDKFEPKVAYSAVVQVSGTDSIYWSIDGTDPSASVGFVSAPGDFIYLESPQQVKEFKVTKVTNNTSIEAMFVFGV